MKRSGLGRDSALLTGSGCCYLEHFEEQESRAPIHLSQAFMTWITVSPIRPKYCITILSRWARVKSSAQVFLEILVHP